MEKLKMHSPNLVAQNIEQLAALFPNCVTESQGKDGELKRAIDFDLLKQELSAHIVDGPQERYQLNWPGKREALLTANAPIAKTLRPCREESVNFDTTQNLFIEGDNLDALKLLQETYLGKVKMIYIDPPYNTGKDFIYKDTFSSEQIAHEVSTGDRAEDGVRLVANPEGNGRFHSNWLTMITPRIRLARNLLTQDGAIFVSCDEGEQPRLRLLMDEVFGRANFVADMVWAAGRKNDSRLVSVSHEYIICYARDVEYLKGIQITWRQRKKGLDEIYAQYERLKRQHGDDFKAMTGGLREWYRALTDGHPSKDHKHYSNIDKRGVYFASDISWPGGGGPKYEVLHPVTKKPVKIPSRGWMTSDPKRMQEWIDDERVHFGEDENAVPCIKSYLKDKEQQTPYSVFYQDGRAASKRLRTLMDGDLFDFPKDELVLQEIVEMLTAENDIIVDFFAGSSTTAHAVMLQNATDGGNRKFIMVQLNESVNEKSSAYDAGFETIAEISRERIRRAAKEILNGKCHDDWEKDIGFRSFKIDSSNMTDVHYNPDAIIQDDLFAQVDNIKADRTEEDLLFQVMLDWGVDLMAPILRQTIDGKNVFFVDADAQHQRGALVACFDKTGGIDDAFIRQLAAFSPLRLVFRDAGFASDAVKINAEQLLKQLSPLTEVKAI
ncbi:site-specific DNA-methyltransferase [Aeromonas caviae]|uniref:site-specific DNA-methyltransferase n=1 Tax=Aeromonas caviae TaxID=648 RepID=UPI002B24CA58|nr:site-specific DNA-methyltransferase [Aeromonas caviae]MEA9423594.1 site-specific DNA-methyltransferase [Aeromonas caviae]